MDMLEAVNTVLPYMGEHVVTRIEGAKHPSVDLIQAAIKRQQVTLLTTGWWFNELHLKLFPNPQGFIDVPENTLEAYGKNISVTLDGERFFNLDEGSRYFTKPLEVKIVRNVPFEKLPETAALYVTYKAAIEVYTADLGAEDVLQVLNNYANDNLVSFKELNLRQRKYNSKRTARQFSSYNRLRHR